MKSETILRLFGDRSLSICVGNNLKKSLLMGAHLYIANHDVICDFARIIAIICSG